MNSILFLLLCSQVTQGPGLEGLDDKTAHLLSRLVEMRDELDEYSVAAYCQFRDEGASSGIGEMWYLTSVNKSRGCYRYDEISEGTNNFGVSKERCSTVIYDPESVYRFRTGFSFEKLSLDASGDERQDDLGISLVRLDPWELPFGSLPFRTSLIRRRASILDRLHSKEVLSCESDLHRHSIEFRYDEQHNINVLLVLDRLSNDLPVRLETRTDTNLLTSVENNLDKGQRGHLLSTGSYDSQQ